MGEEESSTETSAGGDFATMVGISVGLFFLLYALLKMARQWERYLKRAMGTAESVRVKSKDPFRGLNGYNWDYVMVVKVHSEDQKITQMQQDCSVRWILNRLHMGGLETKMFYSAQHDEVYCKIRCNMDRIEREADRINYMVPLDPDALQNVCCNGREGKWQPLNIVDVNQECEFGPYDCMYGKYEYKRADVAGLYKHASNGTCFRGVDRLKLIQSIINARPFQGGCFLDIPKLKKNKCLEAFYPLHDRVELTALMLKWLRFCALPSKQPLEDVKDYMGEKIGLYFYWLGHYTTWLISAAVIGLFAWINIAAAGNDPDNAVIIPYFCGFMAIWATVYLESWKRCQADLSLRWGTGGYEENEQARPQFTGEVSKSPVDGSDILYFSRNEKFQRFLLSQSVVLTSILSVVTGVGAIFVFKLFLLTPPTSSALTSGGVALGSIIASIANAIFIQIANAIYGNIALRLTDRENHRTDTEYEDNLIGKTFLFQFVNSYAALFYIAFIKESTEGCISSCMTELQTALGTIFITRLAVGNLTEVGIPYIKSMLKRKEESAGASRELSQVEEEFTYTEYDVLLGPFDDYSEMAIQFGYSTLFIAAFPLALMMSLVNNYIEIRVDAWKLCQQCRRPEPRTAEDIGTWQAIMEIMAIFAVMVNSALICFTGRSMQDDTWAMRIWYFVIIEHSILLVKYALSILIPDVPYSVEIQRKRQEFVISKVFDNVPDEGDEELVSDLKRVEVDLSIRMTDDDPN